MLKVLEGFRGSGLSIRRCRVRLLLQLLLLPQQHD